MRSSRSRSKDGGEDRAIVNTAHNASESFELSSASFAGGSGSDWKRPRNELDSVDTSSSLFVSVSGMALDSFDAHDVDTASWLQQSPRLSLMHPDDKVGELDEDAKAALDVISQRWMKQGVKPSQHPKIAADIAAATGLDVSQVDSYYQRLEPMTASTGRTPGVAVVSLSQQSIATQQRGHHIFETYVEACRSKQYCTRTTGSSQVGIFRCIWPDCDRNFRKEGDWRRHVELRRPQQVYLCCLCMSASLTVDKVFVHYRKDKLLQHVMGHHGQDVDSDHVAHASLLFVSDARQGICHCGYQYAMWDQYIRHCAGHFKRKQGSTVPDLQGMIHDMRDSAYGPVPITPPSRQVSKSARCRWRRVIPKVVQLASKLRYAQEVPRKGDWVSLVRAVLAREATHAVHAGSLSPTVGSRTNAAEYDHLRGGLASLDAGSKVTSRWHVIMPLVARLARQRRAKEVPRVGDWNGLVDAVLAKAASHASQELVVSLDTAGHAGRGHSHGDAALLDAARESTESSRVASTASSSTGQQRTRVWSETNEHTMTMPSTASAAATIAKQADPASGDHELDESVWSDDGLEPPVRELLIARLVNQISTGVDASAIADHADLVKSETTPKEVAELLKIFATLLDSVADAGIRHRSTVFVRMQRTRIAEGLITTEASRPPQHDGMSLDEIMLRWDQSSTNIAEHPRDLDVPQYPSDPCPELGSDTDSEVELESAELPAIERFLLGGSEFSWLIRQVAAIICRTLESTGSEQKSIRATLARALQKSSQPKEGARQLCIVLPPSLPLYDPMQDAFRGHSLAEVVCIVGQRDRAYMCTCHDYVGLIWPGMGTEVLRCLGEALETATTNSGDRGAIDTDHTGRGFTLNVRRSSVSQDVTVTVKSLSPITLVEVGEVICWLAAACSGSQGASRTIETRLSAFGAGHRIELSCVVLKDEALHEASIPGSCWTRMLEQAVLIQGYPIPQRQSEEPGLEISLDLLTSLSNARRATMFDGQLILKGFCTMLVHVGRTASSSMWHFLGNDDLSWMCYNQAKAFAHAKASFADLGAARHFVGWAERGINRAGTEHAMYNDIAYAGRKCTSPGFAFDGVTVNVAKIIGMGTKILPGVRSRWLCRESQSTGPYERKMHRAAQLRVLFYGERDRRAWLIDGASALLHICRAGLTHKDAPSIRESFDMRTFTHAIDTGDCKRGALAVLLDPRNRTLKLYEDDDYTFQKLAEEYFEILCEIVSHQAKLKSSETKQWQANNPLSCRLEGFAFVDILATKQAFEPRYAVLKDSGSKWMRMVVDSGTIVIFGSTFGDLLQSTSSDCAGQRYIPRGLDLLAVPMATLRSVAAEMGEDGSGATDVELVTDLWWNVPHRSFGSTPCACAQRSVKTGNETHCGKRVTELCDHRRTQYRGKRRKLDSVFDLYPTGVVVFGAESALKHADPESQRLQPVELPVNSDRTDSTPVSAPVSEALLESRISPNSSMTGPRNRGTSLSSSAAGDGARAASPIPLSSITLPGVARTKRGESVSNLEKESLRHRQKIKYQTKQPSAGSSLGSPSSDYTHPQPEYPVRPPGYIYGESSARAPLDRKIPQTSSSPSSCRLTGFIATVPRLPAEDNLPAPTFAAPLSIACDERQNLAGERQRSPPATSSASRQRTLRRRRSRGSYDEVTS